MQKYRVSEGGALFRNGQEFLACPFSERRPLYRNRFWTAQNYGLIVMIWFCLYETMYGVYLFHIFPTQYAYHIWSYMHAPFDTICDWETEMGLSSIPHLPWMCLAYNAFFQIWGCCAPFRPYPSPFYPECVCYTSRSLLFGDVGRLLSVLSHRRGLFFPDSSAIQSPNTQLLLSGSGLRLSLSPSLGSSLLVDRSR